METPAGRNRGNALASWAVAAILLFAAAFFYAIFKWPRPSLRHRAHSNFHVSAVPAPDDAFDAARPDILRQAVPEEISRIAAPAGESAEEGEGQP